jgi:hypothetical protein
MNLTTAMLLIALFVVIYERGFTQRYKSAANLHEFTRIVIKIWVYGS